MNGWMHRFGHSLLFAAFLCLAGCVSNPSAQLLKDHPELRLADGTKNALQWAKFDDFELKFYQFSTGQVRGITNVQKWPGVGFSISSDRKWLLFAPRETHGSDLMLVENFR